MILILVDQNLLRNQVTKVKKFNRIQYKKINQFLNKIKKRKKLLSINNLNQTMMKIGCQQITFILNEHFVFSILIII